MPRALTNFARQNMYASTTDEAFLILATIRHEPTSTILRVVNNTENIVSRGNTFEAYPFSLILPAESGEGIGAATFEIDNVDLTLVDMLRAAIEAPRVDIEVILASVPNEIEIGIYDLAMREVTWDATTITGKLLNEDILSAAFPSFGYTPKEWQGLF
jgi:hypothetical protein